MDNEVSRLFIDRNLCRGKFEFFFIQRNLQRGTVAVAQPIVMDVLEAEDNQMLQQDPIFTIDLNDKTFMQELIDELWNLGIRPSNAKVSNDLIEAKDQHLEDLRKIAFDKISAF